MWAAYSIVNNDEAHERIKELILTQSCKQVSPSVTRQPGNSGHLQALITSEAVGMQNPQTQTPTPCIHKEYSLEMLTSHLLAHFECLLAAGVPSG